MAADTRPYKSKEQDGQGNELIIRDQQLVEQDTTTTMPAGTCFQTLDVDGRPVKIPKANMVDIVREALGTLLNGLSDQTTVAKFLTLNGNTLGASAAATAASVLGALVYISDTADVDADTLNTPSVINIHLTNKTLAELNLPTELSGVTEVAVITYATTSFGFQLAYSIHNTTKKFIRFKWGNWSNMDGWKQLSLV